MAFRAWVWKALDQRRRDPELRAWADILEAAASLMVRHSQPVLGEKFSALRELIRESITVAEAYDAVDVAKRQHVAKVLDFPVDNGGRANRSVIGERLGLAQANLTRVLNMMSAAGLIKRTTLGKQAVFSLSSTRFAAQRRQSEGDNQT